MTRISRLPVLAAAVVAATFYFSAGIPAFSQQISAPEKVSIAASKAKRAPVNSYRAHVYLLRGLMNIFSLGMDDLAQKLERRGVSTTVLNYAEWQSLSDEIAAKYKAGHHGAVILVGHSLGADAVMMMGEYLGTKGVPVALIVPFDGTASFAATANVARVMNITQREYAYMRRGHGFRGELANINVSKDESIGHITIDKSSRLHGMVINRILGIIGGRRPAAPAAHTTEATATGAATPQSKTAAPTASDPAANTSAATVPAVSSSAPSASPTSDKAAQSPVVGVTGQTGSITAPVASAPAQSGTSKPGQHDTPRAQTNGGAI